MTEPGNLAELETTLARDLDRLNLPANNWVPQRPAPNGDTLLDVLVVGGGMCGLTAAFALRRLGISNLRVIDAAPPGRQGPWRTFARMRTLRSPKHLTGPAMGLPNLSFRAWYEAQFGDAAWEDLGRIPTSMWADYVDWYGRVTGANVDFNVRLAGIEVSDNCIIANLQSVSGESICHARRIVLATGREALAAPRIPPPLAPFLGETVFHTFDAPRSEQFAGRRVAVIGLAASAFDYAGLALESGASHVTIVGRKSAIPSINKAKQIVYPGFTIGFADLPDLQKLEIFAEIFEPGIAPPRDSVLRVTKHPNLEIRLNCEITTARKADGALEMETTSGAITADIVVLGTGFRVDVAADRALAAHAPHIKTWQHTVPDRPDFGELLDFPYLGPGFEFQPVSDAPEATAHMLNAMHCFNHTAMISLGNLANDIPAVSDGAERLAQAIARSLFLEDRDLHRQNLAGYVERELLGDESPGIPHAP